MRTETQLLEPFRQIDNKITRITPYLRNVKTVSQFSFGTWNSRQHMILAIAAGEKTGFGESIIFTLKQTCVCYGMTWRLFIENTKL